MRPTIELLLPDDERVVVGPGALVGRLRTAQVRVPDPRISEAHALFVLRGRSIRLLALRGTLVADGARHEEVFVAEGMSIHLAQGVALRILAVNLPETVLGLNIEGLGLVVPEGTSSLFATPSLRSGWDPAADDWIWPDEEEWFRHGVPPVRIAPGDRWTVGPTRIEAVATPLRGSSVTEANTALAPPIVLELFYDTVHLKRRHHDVVVLRSSSARVVSEVATSNGPIPWQDVARALWGQGDEATLRKRWDAQLYRIRRTLRRAGLPPKLLQSDGTGLYELVLRPEDSVLDRT